jgi:NodT family efflux transporter outer membrane factor (OMF) lipoprotein
MSEDSAREKSAPSQIQRSFRLALVVSFLGLSGLTGCSVGPKYVKPTTVVPTEFKEAGNWKTAQPADTQIKGKWWELYQDPQLNTLEDQLTVSNQTLRAAQDQFLQARAAVRFARGGLFPQVTASVTPIEQRQSSTKINGPPPAGNYPDYYTAADVSYEADVWGRVRKTVEASRAQAQASAGDLESTSLSLHAELAMDYFTLRGLDAQKQLLDTTVDAFQKALDLTEDRFRGGLASREDVEEADTQLEQTRAQDIDVTEARDEFEHAVAVLTGQLPSNLDLKAFPLTTPPPAIPPGLPSELLERRPDIAANERLVEAANVQVGLAKIAFFPLLTLNAVGGFESGTFTRWLTGPSALWSVAGTAAETVFDAGRRRAVSDQAKAGYDEAVANYQQTVLTAFQQVEDSLSDLRVLDDEAKTQDAAVAAAQRTLDQATNRYKGGLDTYLTVITAQSVALTNERTALDILVRRMNSSVLLVKALGGGWDVSKLPSGN